METQKKSKLDLFIQNEAPNLMIHSKAVDALIDIITKLPGNPSDGRAGGFLAVYYKSIDSMITKSFGKYPIEKMFQYLTNATEKVIRLLKNEGGHYRSFQSRNEVNSQWGGGIYYGPLYCAFSGFPEKLDEALSLIYTMFVVHSSQWDHEQFRTRVIYEQMQRYADNEYIEPVLNAFVPQYDELVDVN